MLFIDSCHIVNAGHLIQVSCIASVLITNNLLLQLNVLWVKYHLNRKIHMTFHVISIIWPLDFWNGSFSWCSHWTYSSHKTRPEQIFFFILFSIVENQGKIIPWADKLFFWLHARNQFESLPIVLAWLQLLAAN